MVDIHQWCPVGRAHGKFFGAIADVPGGSHPATSVTGSGFPSDMDAVQTKQNLIKHLLRHRDDLRRLGVQRLGLFGSFQRGESDADNDVDLLVEFAPGERDYTKERRKRLRTCLGFGLQARARAAEAKIGPRSRFVDGATGRDWGQFAPGA